MICGLLDGLVRWFSKVEICEICWLSIEILSLRQSKIDLGETKIDLGIPSEVSSLLGSSKIDLGPLARNSYMYAFGSFVR